MSLQQVTRGIMIDAGGGEATIFVSDIQPFAPATASISWSSDGSFSYTPLLQESYWCNPQIYASNYWGRLTLLGGDAPDGPALSTWHALSSTRTWTLEIPFGIDTKTSTLRFEISTNSSGTDIISSVDIQMTVSTA